MIFQHTLDKVLSGEKTQTRRICKPGDTFFPEDLGDPAAVMHKGFSVYRLMWEVGKDYAVCPGRGKAQVARIRINGIRCEDVREISDEDVKAEGFQDSGDFWFTWVSMHDKSFLETYRYAHDMGYLREYGFYSRPEKRYQAWVIEFKLVTGEIADA